MLEGMMFFVVISVLILIFLFKNMILIRAGLILSGFFFLYVIFQSYHKLETSTIILLAVFILINCVHLFFLLKNKYYLKLSKEQEKIFQLVFSPIEKLRFKKLMKISKSETIPENTSIIKHGTKLEKLILITEGTAKVVTDGKNIATLRDGSFAGEMSFISGEYTCADVISTSELKYLYWEKKVLDELTKKHPEIYNGLKSVLNFDLMLKLSGQNEKSKENN